jgi:hypothetical protein
MKKALVSIIFFLALIITLYYTITIEQLTIVVEMFSLRTFIVCLLIYFVSYILRGYRYHIVIGNPRLTYIKLLPVIMLYQFFVRILPLKSGELTFLYLLKKYRNIDLHQSANSLLFVKVIDLISILFLFISLNAIPFMDVTNNFELTFVFIVNIILTSLFMRFYIPIFEFVKVFLKSRTWKFLKYDLVIRILSYNRIFSMKEIIFISINTSAIWISLYILLLLLIQGSISISIIEQIQAITYAFIGNILPINGLGGFGAQEASWTIGFMQKNVDYSLSLITGVYVNVISFLYVIIFGAFGWLYLNKKG